LFVPSISASARRKYWGEAAQARLAQSRRPPASASAWIEMRRCHTWGWGAERGVEQEERDEKGRMGIGMGVRRARRRGCRGLRGLLVSLRRKILSSIRASRDWLVSTVEVRVLWSESENLITVPVIGHIPVELVLASSSASVKGRELDCYWST
jgi:hypothetical protein